MTLTRQFWMSFRQALLMVVDALEREPELEFRGERTAKLRKDWKDEQRGKPEGS